MEHLVRVLGAVGGDGRIAGAVRLEILGPLKVQHAHPLHAGRGAAVGGNALALGAVVYKGVEVAALRGGRTCRHRDLNRPAAPDVGETGIGAAQAAVGADRHLLQSAGGGGKTLVGQIFMDLLHNGLPHADGRVAGGGDLLVGLGIARPHRGAVIGGIAHKVADAAVVGGTGLTGNGHAAELGGGAGTGVHHAGEHLVHEVGGGLLHGRVGLPLIFQNGLAIAVPDLGIHLGGVVNAIVGEGGEGRRHLLGAEAVGQAAHAQGGNAHILRHQTEAQLFRGIGIGFRHAQLLDGLDRDGVDRPPDALADHGPAGVGIGGVLRPGRIVHKLHGVVIKGGGRCHSTGVQRCGIHRQRLDRRTNLMLLDRIVVHQILGLGAHGAHHAHDVAGIGVHDGDTGLQLVALGRVYIQIAQICVDILRDLLDIRVHGAIDLIAAIVHQPLGRFIRNALGLSQICGHILDELLHKPVVDLDTVGLDQLAGVSGGICEVQRLRLGGFALLFCQIGLAGIRIDDLRHLVQNQLLPLLVQLPRGDGGAVLPGVGAVIFGVVKGRVVGDGDDAGALRRRQILGGLTEIVFRRRFHARTAAAQINHVQVQLQNLAFRVVLLKFQRPEDLLDLAVNGVLIFAGHVFQHLLGDGGAAVAVVAAGEGQQRSAQGPLPVYTVVTEKTLVLNGHRRLPQVGGHIVDVDQDTVLLPVDLLELHPLTALLVLIIDHGALGHGVVLCPDLQRRQQRCIHILHENPQQHERCADADQDQGKDRHHNAARHMTGPDLPPFAGMIRPLGMRVSSFLQLGTSFCDPQGGFPSGNQPTIHHYQVHYIIPCQLRKCRIQPAKSFRFHRFYQIFPKISVT